MTALLVATLLALFLFIYTETQDACAQALHPSLIILSAAIIVGIAATWLMLGAYYLLGWLL